MANDKNFKADKQGRHWAIVSTLIQAVKLNDLELLARLTDVLERIISGRTKRLQLNTLLPWNWDGPRLEQITDTA